MAFREATVQHTETLCFCDICDEKVSHNPRCYICHRHICSSHTIFAPRDDGGYPTKYCKSCWDVGAPFRDEIAHIELEADRAEYELNKQWSEKAMQLLEIFK